MVAAVRGCEPPAGGTSVVSGGFGQVSFIFGATSNQVVARSHPVRGILKAVKAEL